MELSLTATLVILAAALAVLAFAWRKHRQPTDLLKLRLINYGLVQLLCVFVVLIIGAHLVTLIVGHPVTGSPQNP